MQVTGLSYTYKKHFSLRDVDLELKQGQVAFLFGRNGSGKTTLFNLIAGILRPLSGDIQVSLESLFYLPASPYLDNGLLVNDVYDILGCNQSLTKQNGECLKTETLRFKSISQISSGEYKRVWLVAALSSGCQVLLLDEPLVYLDWPFQNILQKLLIERSQQGQSFLITTHNFNWSLGFPEAYAWILPPPLHKYRMIDALKSNKFKKTFQSETKIADNPLNGKKILILS